jgi:hypothetical protein
MAQIKATKSLNDLFCNIMDLLPAHPQMTADTPA